MSGPGIAVAALVLGMMAFAFVIGTPILGVPIALLLLVVFGALQLARRRKEARQLQGFREEAMAESVEFTPRDQETLTTE